MPLLSALREFFTVKAPLRPSERLLVAFSGGTDSTALLWGLARMADELEVRLDAAHLDHALDPDSARRAAGARDLAATLGVPLSVARRPVATLRRSGESPEAAARRVRYDFLGERRRELGARYVVTAHHRGDQIETVLLRLLHGSGLMGLAGMKPRRGALVRPLLALSRRTLADTVAAAGLTPIDDPTNRDLRVPRNRLRHLLVPRVGEELPELEERLWSLSRAAAGATAALARRLLPRLEPARCGADVTVSREALGDLPAELWPFALAPLHREAGVGYPPSARALADLRRQVVAGAAVGCDLGGRWRWESQGDRLALRRSAAARVPRFAYTLSVPGEVELPEIASRMRISRQSPAAWMFRGSRRRTGLAFDLPPRGRLTVRNRRPGDRVRPLGCSYHRRLKDLLIEGRVPRRERDGLPLLCLGDRILWVPGLTIDDRCRISRNRPVWVAEIETG